MSIDILLENHWLTEVCYTGGKVFQGVTVDTTILVCNKTSKKEIVLKDATDFEKQKMHTVPADFFAAAGNIISIGNDERNSIFNKLFAKDLKQISDSYTIYQGIVTGNNTAFIFETEAEAREKGIEKELLHPLCHGRDIGRYETRSLGRRILYVDNSINIKQFPNAEKWLSEFKSDLKKRRETVKGTIKWYGLQWPRVKAELDINEKILIQNTRNENLSVRICATLDATGVYGSQGINFVIAKKENANLHFLLAVLNSSLINYLFATKFLNLAIKAEYVKQVRLPSATLEQQESLAKLADEMLAVKKQLASFSGSDADRLLLEQRVSLIDNQINALVYKLYGLTEEEIRIVEGK